MRIAPIARRFYEINLNIFKRPSARRMGGRSVAQSCESQSIVVFSIAANPGKPITTFQVVVGRCSSLSKNAGRRVRPATYLCGQRLRTAHSEARSALGPGDGEIATAEQMPLFEKDQIADHTLPSRYRILLTLLPVQESHRQPFLPCETTIAPVVRNFKILIPLDCRFLLRCVRIVGVFLHVCRVITAN